MKTLAELYPQRSRDENVRLIKNVMYAQSQAEHDNAVIEFSNNLHPSLFAELDWMEMSIPEQHKQRAAELSDSLFFNNLEKIIRLRYKEFELEDNDLFQEILENNDFYRYILEIEPVISNEFDDKLRTKIKETYRKTMLIAETEFSLKNTKLDEYIIVKLNSIKDIDVLPLYMREIVTNQIAYSLDHISSRIRAKKFIRKIDNKLPDFFVEAQPTAKRLQTLTEQVKDLAELARKYVLGALYGTLASILKYLENIDPLHFNQFEGERANGYGHCGNCSMMFSSSAIVSFDSFCPNLYDVTTDRITLPLEFNTAKCPFCGAVKRINVPAMFYIPKRNSVIYCIPTMGQNSEEEAEQVYGEMINRLRENYIAKISEEEAQKFNQANEEITYSTIKFLTAIQMGTSNVVWHAFSRVNLAGGRALLVDPTMGVIIELIDQGEIHEMWDINPQELNETKGISNALTVFDEEDYERAEVLLKEQLELNPGHMAIKKYLALTYKKNGKIDLAQDLMEI